MATVLFQLFVTQLPLNYLLAHVVNDDTFYYLEIAHRAAHGQGFTFDGINRTNGFPPAWQLLLTALATITPSKEDLLRLTLILCTVLNFATGLIICAISEAALGQSLSVICLLIWSSVQLVPSLSLTGMETSLNWLVFSFLLWRVIVAAKRKLMQESAAQTYSSLGSIATGLGCGVLFLCRVDNLIYVASIFVLMG
ncbi:MAG: hypothetical protein QME66_02055 [Candidatus Eisenbacteria bacterium]|nr:hypothetical protein [Candidatus Eisenbacteria bacterium]